jgi:polygalacturonase
MILKNLLLTILFH